MRQSDLKIVNLTFQLVVVFNFRLLFACCNDDSFRQKFVSLHADPFGDHLALRSRRRSRWFPPFFVANDPEREDHLSE